jgi:hypothetical protein
MVLLREAQAPRAGHYRTVSALGCEGSALVTDEPGT